MKIIKFNRFCDAVLYQVPTKENTVGKKKYFFFADIEFIGGKTERRVYLEDDITSLYDRYKEIFFDKSLVSIHLIRRTDSELTKITSDDVAKKYFSLHRFNLKSPL